MASADALSSVVVFFRDAAGIPTTPSELNARTVFALRRTMKLTRFNRAPFEKMTAAQLKCMLPMRVS